MTETFGAKIATDSSRIAILDGLRACLVIPVLLYHSTPDFSGRISHIVSNPFTSVSIFLVLSGFLNTSILLRGFERSGSLDIKGFYWRRALRLLPALVVLVALWILYMLTLSPQRLSAERLASTALIQLSFATNIEMAFRAATEWRFWDGFGHLWSLALEGQFYLLLPLLLACTKARARLLIPALIFFTILCATHRALLFHDQSDFWRVYVATDTRIDALLTGSLLALLLQAVPAARKAMLSPPLRILGLFLFLLLMALPVAVSFEDFGIFCRGGFTALDLSTCFVLVYLLENPAKSLRMFLENPVLTWFGRISYSLFIWHFVIYRILDLHLSEWNELPLVSVKLVLALIISAASFHLVEEPLMRRMERARRSERRAF